VTLIEQHRFQPWGLHYIEEAECDVLLMNLGFHYPPGKGEGRKEDQRQKPPLPLHDPSVLGLVQWAVNWTQSGKDRVAIWRETTPQHWNHSANGLWVMDRSKDRYWSPLNEAGCMELNNPKDGQMFNQNFNKILTGLTVPSPGGDRARLKSLRGRKIRIQSPTEREKFWEAFKWREEMEQERQRKEARGGRAQEGIVYVLDLHQDLAGHPEWHMNKGDCTHFCFLPALWDFLFERLALHIAAITEAKS